MADSKTVGLTGFGLARTELGADDDAPASVIGPYRLLQRIGEGGMGEVWLAEQEEPIRRRVALKIIKRGMDTKEFVARFESERQALAMMDHPCIAKVFAAGATPRGRPYFVMEYVPGIPITEHCDRHKLCLRERLELFVKVCHGVQHAHQKAIIHRDLKPSNVLVTLQDGGPLPKIIDFGVAKATSQPLTSHTMHTALGQIVGTPEYMSPEQADLSAQNVDTRTDVYALGVLLYELLTGVLPFDSESLRQRSFTEIQRLIREQDPPRPSTRVGGHGAELAAVAASRGVAPSRLCGHLKGDLDWIVMKALEKDRTRRYETANALAMDIDRHLRHVPVHAGPPSTGYRMRKFVRRNRAAVAAYGVILIALVLGTFGTTIGMVRAQRAGSLARAEATAAREVSDFLVGLFEVSDPNEARGNTITAREILDEGAARIRSELSDQPATRARLMETIGRVYKRLGLYNEATPFLEEALAASEDVHGGASGVVAGTLSELADLYVTQARYAEAEALLQRALAIQQPAGNDELALAGSLMTLASGFRRQGDYAAAEPLYRRALELRRHVHGSEHPEVAQSLNGLAILNWNLGRYAAAESLYQQALGIWERMQEPNHPDVARGLNNLALLYHEMGRQTEALPLYQRAIAIYEQTLGPDHTRLALALNNLALAYSDLGDLDEAEPLFARALEIRRRALGESHPDVAQTLNNLANLQRRRGDLAAAEPLYRQALDIRRRELGADHPDVGWSLRDLGLLYRERGDLALAAETLAQALATLRGALGTDHPETDEVVAEYTDVLLRLGRDAEAASVLARSGAPSPTGEEATTR